MRGSGTSVSSNADWMRRSARALAIEVKGGKHANIGDVRSLRGVLENGAVQMTGLIVLEPLGAGHTM